MYMAMAKKRAFKFRATTDNAIICCMYVSAHTTTSEMQKHHYHKNS